MQLKNGAFFFMRLFVAFFTLRKTPSSSFNRLGWNKHLSDFKWNVSVSPFIVPKVRDMADFMAHRLLIF